MFKRILISALAALMLFSTVACSNKTTVESPDETGEVTSSTSAETEHRFEIPDDAVLSDTQKEAAESAQQHLDVGISRAKLIEALTNEGYSEEDAIYAIEIFNIDWMEMARGTAEFYTYYMPFSYQGLIDHLIYMEFTPEQAQYGADQVEVDWDSMAEKYIEKYYLYGSFTNDEIIAELTKAGFTEEQAKNGLKEYEDALAEESSLREELGLD